MMFKYFWIKECLYFILIKFFNKRDKVRNLSVIRGRGRLYIKEWFLD